MKVQLVGFPIGCHIGQSDALRFNSNAALALDIHGVKNLGCHLSLAKAPTHLDKAIGDRGFTMIDMGNDREVSNMAKVRQKFFTTVQISGRSLAYLQARRHRRFVQMRLSKALILWAYWLICMVLNTAFPPR